MNGSILVSIQRLKSCTDLRLCSHLAALITDFIVFDRKNCTAYSVIFLFKTTDTFSEPNKQLQAAFTQQYFGQYVFLDFLCHAQSL